jgi:hypothetical protein
MITFSVTGLQQAVAKIAQIQRNLAQPKTGLERATHKVAEVFEKNYDSEGGLVGGWPDLAEKTQNMRAWQGFEPEHPIMIRYGSFRAVAVEFFKTAKDGHVFSSTDDYSDQTVTGSLQIAGNKATLQVGGSYKVLNQWGYGNTNGSGDNPARPYWFIDRQSVAAGVEGIRDWIENEVLA